MIDSSARRMWLAGILLLAAQVALVLTTDQDNPGDVVGSYVRPDTPPIEIFHALGYKSEEFFVTTPDGYIIHLTRATNPLINNGEPLEGSLPIVFFHGTLCVGALFLANSAGCKPKNFRESIDLNPYTDPQVLHKELKNDISSKNMPCLALNFGFEVWLVDRRGFSKSSRQRVGHENRTLLDAIESIPASLLSNGFHPFAGLKPGRRGKLETNKDILEELFNTDRVGPSAKLKPEQAPYFAFLQDVLQSSISLKNLPLALDDFGHFTEDFIQTFDPEYWDYSLDEQALYDCPTAIDFVLKYSGKPRVHTVGLSSGGAIILMASAAKPRLARKIASAILWAPSLNLGAAKDIVFLLGELVRPTQSYSGPILFTFMMEQVQGLLQKLCSTDYNQRHVCSRLADLFLGYSGFQSPLTQSVIAEFIASTSYHELAHLGQFAHTDTPCRFNHGDPARNLREYNQLEPPCYDLSRVKLRYISIYTGNNDQLVSYGAANITRSQLGVSCKHTFINEPGIQFNHGGSIIHQETDRLVLIPSLIDFERAQSGLTTLNLPRVPLKRPLLTKGGSARANKIKFAENES